VRVLQFKVHNRDSKFIGQSLGVRVGQLSVTVLPRDALTCVQLLRVDRNVSLAL